MAVVGDVECHPSAQNLRLPALFGRIDEYEDSNFLWNRR